MNDDDVGHKCRVGGVGCGRLRPVSRRGCAPFCVRLWASVLRCLWLSSIAQLFLVCLFMPALGRRGERESERASPREWREAYTGRQKADQQGRRQGSARIPAAVLRASVSKERKTTELSNLYNIIGMIGLGVSSGSQSPTKSTAMGCALWPLLFLCGCVAAACAADRTLSNGRTTVVFDGASGGIARIASAALPQRNYVLGGQLASIFNVTLCAAGDAEDCSAVAAEDCGSVGFETAGAVGGRWRWRG